MSAAHITKKKLFDYMLTNPPDGMDVEEYNHAYLKHIDVPYKNDKIVIDTFNRLGYAVLIDTYVNSQNLSEAKMYIQRTPPNGETVETYYERYKARYVKPITSKQFAYVMYYESYMIYQGKWIMSDSAVGDIQT